MANWLDILSATWWDSRVGLSNLVKLFLYWQKYVAPVNGVAQVWNCPVVIWLGHRTDDTLGASLFDIFFLLVFECTNKINALLDGTHGRDFVIDLHWFQRVCLQRISSSLVLHRLVEEFALILEQNHVCLALHDAEVALPLSRQLEVLFRWWKSFSRTFFQRHPCFLHHFLQVLVRLFWYGFELLNFCMSAGANIGDTRQFICGVSVLDSEAWSHLLRLLVKILAEVLVQPSIIVASCDVETFIPFWWGSRFFLSFACARQLFFIRLRTPFHLILHHLRLTVLWKVKLLGCCIFLRLLLLNYMLIVLGGVSCLGVVSLGWHS